MFSSGVHCARAEQRFALSRTIFSSSGLAVYSSAYVEFVARAETRSFLRSRWNVCKLLILFGNFFSIFPSAFVVGVYFRQRQRRHINMYPRLLSHIADVFQKHQLLHIEQTGKANQLTVMGSSECINNGVQEA